MRQVDGLVDVGGRAARMPRRSHHGPSEPGGSSAQPPPAAPSTRRKPLTAIALPCGDAARTPRMSPMSATGRSSNAAGGTGPSVLAATQGWRDRRECGHARRSRVAGQRDAGGFVGGGGSGRGPRTPAPMTAPSSATGSTRPASRSMRRIGDLGLVGVGSMIIVCLYLRPRRPPDAPSASGVVRLGAFRRISPPAPGGSRGSGRYPPRWSGSSRSRRAGTWSRRRVVVDSQPSPDSSSAAARRSWCASSAAGSIAAAAATAPPGRWRKQTTESSGSAGMASRSSASAQRAARYAAMSSFISTSRPRPLVPRCFQLAQSLSARKPARALDAQLVEVELARVGVLVGGVAFAGGLPVGCRSGASAPR